MLFIDAGDALRALAVPEAVAVIGRTYAAQAAGRVRASVPSLMTLPGTGHRLGAKGAVLDDAGVAGVRLLSAAGSRIMLWSLETGRALALVDETELYRFRTGLSAAVVAGLLRGARRGEVVAVVGAGPIARRCAEGLQHLVAPAEMRVASRGGESAARLASALAGAGVAARGAKSVREAVDGADLVVTMTTADRPFLHAAMLGPGTTVLSMGGGPELGYDVWAGAEGRYVDDMDYALGKGDARGWIEAGETDAASFEASLSGTVGELALGRLAAPESGRAVAIVQGFAGLDVALAHAAVGRLQGRAS